MFMDEMTLIGRVTKKRMKEVRERVVQVIQRQGEAGVIAWPVENAHRGRPGKVGSNLQALRRRVPEAARKCRLGSMRLQDISDLIVALANLARGLGILNLEETAGAARDPFLRQAVRLAVDGYEPTNVRCFLEDMKSAGMQHEESVCRMVVIWTSSIRKEEPPALLEQRLRSLYRPGAPERGTYTKATAGSVRKALKGGHLSELTLDEVVEVLMEASILARLRGVKALAGPLGEANHELLANALDLLGREIKGDVLETILMILTDHQEALMARLEVAHKMVMEGLMTIQQGWNPKVIESRVRAIGGI
jgi:flagellar motor component MotA